MKKDRSLNAEKPFDWPVFERLCALPSVITQENIAWIMGVSVDTCQRHIWKQTESKITFADFRQQKSGFFRATLLQKQIDVALSGNVTMLIWLGKQYLSQSEKVEQTQVASEQKLIIRMSDDE